MSNFKATVQAALDYIDRHVGENLKLPGVFGLQLDAETPNGEIADAFFYHVENEALAVLAIQCDETLEQVTARAKALSAAFNVHPPYAEYPTTPAIAVTGFDDDDPVIEGYEVTFALGNREWQIYYVYPQEQAA